MEIKDLEIEGVRIEAFKDGFMSCLNIVKGKLKEEETVKFKTEDTAKTTIVS